MCRDEVTCVLTFCLCCMSSVLPFLDTAFVSLFCALPSLHLCSFTYTWCHRFWAMPAFWLKRQILLNLPSDHLEAEVANSIDFMVERVRQPKCISMYIHMKCGTTQYQWMPLICIMLHVWLENLIGSNVALKVNVKCVIHH